MRAAESPTASRRIAQKEFALFLLLCFLLLGLVPGLQIAFGVPSLDFSAMARAASERSGAPWTSSLVDVVRLALVEPGLWLLVIGSAVPALAAIVTLGHARNRTHIADWLGRYNPARAFRNRRPVDAAIVTATLALIVIALAATYQIRTLLAPGAYQQAAIAEPASLALALLAAAFLDQGAVLEEGGWRAFAMPTLERAGIASARAALVVGVGWGLWHVPRDIVSGVIDRLGAFDYVALYLPSFLAGTIAVSVIAAFCMNRLGGSVFPAIAAHGLANDSIGISGAATIETALTPFHQITKNAPLLAVAALILIAAGPALGADGAAPGRAKPRLKMGQAA